MSEFLNVHHNVVDRNTGELKLVRVTPYIRLQHEGAPPLFIKEGRVADENGTTADPVPDWVWLAAAKCTDKALHDCGFNSADVKRLARTAELKKPSLDGNNNSKTSSGKAA